MSRFSSLINSNNNIKKQQNDVKNEYPELSKNQILNKKSSLNYGLILKNINDNITDNCKEETNVDNKNFSSYEINTEENNLILKRMKQYKKENGCVYGITEKHFMKMKVILIIMFI